MSSIYWKVHTKALGNGITIQWWWDKRAKVWTTRAVDANNDQIGDAEMSHTKAGRAFDIAMFTKAHS